MRMANCACPSFKGEPLKKLSSALLCLTLIVPLQAGPSGQLPVVLGAASTYSVLGASTVTSTGPTIVNGDVGLSPGTAVTGFPPGLVVGGMIHASDIPAGAAQAALTTAYLDAAGRTGAVGLIGDLGGQTLTPGLYQATTTQGLTGTLRLDGQGNPNSVFIFQIGTALTTASGSQIILQNGAQAANIFWEIGSSATLGTNSSFSGTIMAQISITLTTGASLVGRALARTGAVTLDSNTITNPGPPTLGNPPGTLTVTCPSSTASVGVAYNSVIVATGGTPPYTFSVTGTLPAGLTLNTSTGAITGTPTGTGSNPFVARTADSLSGSATNNCSINTALAPPATPVPSSLILVLIGLASIGVYFFRRSAQPHVTRS